MTERCFGHSGVNGFSVVMRTLVAAYWGIAAHSAYDMFSWYTYMYLSVILAFSPPLGLLSGNIFLIAPFPDRCLLVSLWVFIIHILCEIN